MISLVIPTFNEEKNIDKIIESLLKIKIVNEILFVDDNSTDKTVNYIKKYQKQNKIILIRRNKKKSKNLSMSVVEGALKAKNKLIGVMDCDLQHNPKYLIQILNKFKKLNKCELVVASRFLNKNGKNINTFRTMLSKLFIFFLHLIFEKKVSDPLSGFFLLNKYLITDYKSKFFLQGYKILFDILYNGKKQIRLSEIGFIFEKRKYEKSKFNIKIFILIVFQIFYSKFKN